MKLEEFDLKRLFSQMSINLDTYGDRSVEREDVFQDTMEQTLVYTKGDYTRPDFNKLFWHNFRLVKARLFDKRSGKVKYAPTSLYDNSGNFVHEPIAESNNYEQRELVEMVSAKYPVTFELSKGYTLRELAPLMGVSFGRVGQIRRKEGKTINQLL